MAELTELEEKVEVAEDWLLRELQKDRTEAVRVTAQSWPTLSRVEQLAILWFLAKDKVKKRRVKRKRKKRRRTRRWLVDVVSTRPGIWQSLV